MDILSQLIPIFREVFDDDTLTPTLNTSADDVDAWDSLSHINLIMAVELHFKVKFALGELQKLKNVGDLADLVSSKTK